MSDDYVFLSYSHNDDEVANRLYELLQEKGISVWMDKVEIRLGSDWEKAIIKAIENASAVIALITPHAHTSDWIKEEVTLAKKINKPVLRVHVAGKTPKSIQNIKQPNNQQTRSIQSVLDEIASDLQHKFEEPVDELKT